MRIEDIRDSSNRIIGKIEEWSDGRTIVYDKNHKKIGEIKHNMSYLVAYTNDGKFVAEYDTKDDYTYERGHRGRIGKGNLLISLLFKNI